MWTEKGKKGLKMNNVQLIGRVTKDIEMRTTNSGKHVVSFNLAVNRYGSREEADFIPCVAWNKTAELMQAYVKKGNRIGITGRIQTRNYDGPDGKKVYVTEVIASDVEFLTDKNEQKNEPAHGGSLRKEDIRTTPGDAADIFGISSDELPF